MKIIEIVPALASGGGERFVVDLCNELSQKHDVTLLTLYKLEGICDFYLPQISKRVRVVSLNKKRGADLCIFWQVYQFIKKEKPDIIHTHLRAIVYAIIPELFTIHGIHTVHSDAEKEANNKLFGWVRRILFKTGRVTPITISQDSHRSFVEFYGMNAIQIDNGRDIPENLPIPDAIKSEIAGYRKDEQTRVIVQLAHLDDIKRQDLMASVAMRLYNEGYNFTVLFIGRWDSEAFKQKVEKAMPPCCHILGQRQNPLEYLKEAGAFGLCSSYEGFPISLIEALGVGAIPICTPVGGIINVIKDGENGLLSDDISEEAYYRTFKRYLNMTEDQITEMRAKAIQSYAPYSMKECAKKYVEVFKSIQL